MHPKTDGILESSTRFYQETFGFPIISEFGGRGCAMHAGTRQVLLLFKKGASRDRGIAERVLELLAVLQALFEETNEDSSLTPAGLELLQMHFVGDKAWFTDESEQNKRDFAREMTFVDPVDLGKRIFCTWHGKVKKGQFRIHFEWPRPKNQRIIKVVYIGPKITKR